MSESGSVTDTYTYDAFGNLLKSTGRTENNYRYCGEQFDRTTGLYYLRARYMDTNTGRFISQDTYQGNNFEPGTLHKYLYANSNPVTYSDPSGYMYETAVVLLDYSIERAQHDANTINWGIKIIRMLKAVSPLITYASIWGTAIGAMISNVLSGTSADYVTCEDIRDDIIDYALEDTKNENEPRHTLYHYTNGEGLEGILISGYINPSLKTNNPKDAVGGDGQYFSDIIPEDTTPFRLGLKFKNVPNPNLFTHYIEIDVSDLNIKKCRENVFVHNSELPLNIRNRVVRFGKV